MSIKVNCVNEKEAKAQLKKAPKELQEYVKALEASNERWKYVNDEALKKILEQAKNISSNHMLADSCRFYEQDNTTAMNCKHCGKGKWMHGNGNLR